MTNTGKTLKSLLDLPDEILLGIFSYIDLHRSDRVLGHIPDDPPPSLPDASLIRDFVINSSTLCSLALTCRRLKLLAMEQLVHAPVIGLVQAPVVHFVRTLLAHPGLVRHVKQLRLCLPFSKKHAEQSEEYSNSDEGPELEVSDFNEQAREVIDSLNLPTHLKARWGALASANFERALICFFLALEPPLERLCISQNTESSHNELLRYMHNPFSLDLGTPTGVALKALQWLPDVRSLTYLKLESVIPIRLDSLGLFPNLHTLDMSTELANLSYQILELVSKIYASPDVRKVYDNIHHLRLDFQVKTVGLWEVGARLCVADILQAFHNLKSLDFYAEPSDSKNPLRSVRAFPFYQTNIQNYPNVSAPLDPDTENQYWDERVYDARTTVTDYQNLVDILVPLRPQLETLRLPGGFWTLPGGMRKPLPRFDLYTKLRTLVVPQAAIISIKLDNMRFQDVMGDFDLSPTAVLPPTLQYLKIFDADAGLVESPWLRELFAEQKSRNRWPEMQQLKILFGATYGDVELNEVLTRTLHEEFWEWVDEVSFGVVVGRDNEVPSVYVQ